MGKIYDKLNDIDSSLRDIASMLQYLIGYTAGVSISKIEPQHPQQTQSPPEPQKEA